MGLIEGLVNQIPMAEKLLEIKVCRNQDSVWISCRGRRHQDALMTLKELQKLAGLALVENSSGKHTRQQ